MFTRRAMMASTLALAPVSSLVRAESSNWPTRPVKVIVGFPAGQASDTAARMYADELQKAFGQPFVIDNRPGAGATLAANAVAKSVPDGYTLLFTSSGPITIAPHLYGSVGFDPMRDLTVIAITVRAPLMLLVRPDFPAKTLPDLVAMAKRREINFGSGGNGVTNHLALEMFKLATEAKFVHVPYKGATQALTDLIGGQIDAMFETPTAAMSFVRSGRLRALAVTSLMRYSHLPDVPAVAEFYAGFDAVTWAGFAVPSGTPHVIQAKLSAQLRTSLENPVVKEKLKQAGLEPSTGIPSEAIKNYAHAEFAKWGSIIKRAGVKLD